MSDTEYPYCSCSRCTEPNSIETLRRELAARKGRCETCVGRGEVDNSARQNRSLLRRGIYRCPTCKGTGEVPLIPKLQTYEAIGYESEMVTAAFMVACLSFLLQHVTINLMPQGKDDVILDYTYINVPKDGNAVRGTLHEAVVRAAWAVAQEVAAKEQGQQYA